MYYTQVSIRVMFYSAGLNRTIERMGQFRLSLFLATLVCTPLSYFLMQLSMAPLKRSMKYSQRWGLYGGQLWRAYNVAHFCLNQDTLELCPPYLSAVHQPTCNGIIPAANL